MNPRDIITESLGKEASVLFGKISLQRPEPADVIILLQGDRFDRVEVAASLYKEGFAPAVLVIGNNELIGLGKRPEENDVALEELKRALIEKGISSDVIDIENRAMNTRGQALFGIKLAIGKKWRRLLIVTSPYHILRAYYYFQEEADLQHWEGKIIVQTPKQDWDSVPGGREKNALEVLRSEIEKIKKYSAEWLVRKANMSDAKAVWEIRNSLSAREQSLHQSAISLAGHLAWFEKHYSSSTKDMCFVLEHEGIAAGYCRFDEEHQGTFVVSIAIADEYQGRGLGNYLLHYGLKAFPHKGGKEILATIKKSNTVSLVLFQKHGFRDMREDGDAYMLWHRCKKYAAFC